MKTYSPSVFLKYGLKLYNFKSQLFLKCLKFGLSCGKNGRYAHWVHFTHASRHFGVWRKQNKLFRENCFENEVSDVTKKAWVSKKLLSEKSVKTKKQKKLWKLYNLWRILGTKLVLLVNFWDHIFKTVFPKQFLFVSYFKLQNVKKHP